MIHLPMFAEFPAAPKTFPTLDGTQPMTNPPPTIATLAIEVNDVHLR